MTEYTTYGPRKDTESEWSSESLQDELSCSKVFAVGWLADLFMYARKSSTRDGIRTFHAS